MEVHIRSRRIPTGRQDNSPKGRAHKVGNERREEKGHKGDWSYEVRENIWLFIEDLSLFSYDKLRLIDPTSAASIVHATRVEHKEARTLHASVASDGSDSEAGRERCSSLLTTMTAQWGRLNWHVHKVINSSGTTLKHR